jgi:hypothetical protein
LVKIIGRDWLSGDSTLVLKLKFKKLFSAKKIAATAAAATKEERYTSWSFYQNLQFFVVLKFFVN